jgi:hypothetical protein
MVESHSGGAVQPLLADVADERFDAVIGIYVSIRENPVSVQIPKSSGLFKKNSFD